SRAVSLPRSCWRAIFSSPPPSFVFARRSCRSSVSPFIPVSSPASTASGASGASPAWSFLVSSVAAISVPSTLVHVFRERLDALLDVLCREGERELRAQELERVVQVHVLLAVHRVVAQAHQDRALGRELLGPVVDGGLELTLGHDLVRQPVL